MEVREVLHVILKKLSLDVDTSKTTPKETISSSMYSRSRHLLQFWTLAIYLNISLIEAFEGIPEVRQWGRRLSRNGTFLWISAFRWVLHHRARPKQSI